MVSSTALEASSSRATGNRRRLMEILDGDPRVDGASSGSSASADGWAWVGRGSVMRLGCPADLALLGLTGMRRERPLPVDVPDRRALTLEVTSMHGHVGIHRAEDVF